MVGTATSGRRPGLESCGREPGLSGTAHRHRAGPRTSPGYLQDGDLAAGREQGQGGALLVGAEAVALARRGEAEPPQVGEVLVPVQHPALRVPEAGAGPCSGRGLGERPECPRWGTPSHPTACSPKMLCRDFWLGLLAKPLEGPVLAESEVAALPGEASEDGEE